MSNTSPHRAMTVPTISTNLYMAGKSWRQQVAAAHAEADLPWSKNYAVGFEENN